MSDRRYDVMIELDVMVEMRDGVRLATDIYFPASEQAALPGPFPAVLERGPHGKRHAARRYPAGEYWAQRGYIALIQDCRGCFSSEGVWLSETQEIPDGADTIAWIASQPWCDGRVFAHGTSYQGLTALATLRETAPALAGVFPYQGLDVHNVFSTVNGGALDLWHPIWLAGVAALNPSPSVTSIPGAVEELNSVDARQWLRALAWKPRFSLFTPLENYERWLFDALDDGRPVEDHFGLGDSEECADVPAFFASGWYDSEARSTVERYSTLRGRNRSQVRLLMGPWPHGHMSATRSVGGDVDFGADARIADWPGFMKSWFDELLVAGTALDRDGSAVRIFVMGGGTGEITTEGRLLHGGSWRDEPDWPLARARTVSLYLRDEGVLSCDPPTSARASRSYVFDPADPVPTIGGAFVGFTAPRRLPESVPPLSVPFLLRRDVLLMPGPKDQRTTPADFATHPPYGPLAQRPDVLVFSTPPLRSPVEVTGPVAVELWVSSDAPDTDFTAKLIDLYPPSTDRPDGYALLICDGIFRMRFRDGWTPAGPLEDGMPYRVRLELGPTSNLFAAGHAIRIDISSSNFPKYDVNPNTGEPILRATHTRTATNTVFFDESHPSRLIVPVVEAS